VELRNDPVQPVPGEQAPVTSKANPTTVNRLGREPTRRATVAPRPSATAAVLSAPAVTAATPSEDDPTIEMAGTTVAQATNARAVEDQAVIRLHSWPGVHLIQVMPANSWN